MIAVALILMVVWVRLEYRTQEPLIDMRLSRLRSVWTVNAAAFLIGAGMYACFILFPSFTESPASNGYGFGASVSEAGLFLLPLTMMVLLFSLVSSWISVRVGSKVALVAGCIASGVAFLYFAAFNDHPIDAYIATTLLGIGIGLAFASLATLIVAAVPPEQTGEATGVNTVMRTVGGAVGAQVCASVLAGSAVAGTATAAGFRTAFIIVGATSLLGALASLAIPGSPRRALTTSPGTVAAEI
jgi:MFS family permease